MSWQYLLFVFQRRGGEQFQLHAQQTAAAPLKNKEDWVVPWTVL
jgi:hypothetical protein